MNKPNRWACSGSSKQPDLRNAIDEALEQMLAGTPTRNPAVIVAFVSPAYNVGDFATALKESLGDVPVIGCTTAGEITNGKATHQGMVLWGLGGDGFNVRVGFGQGSASGLRDAARDAAACCNELPSGGHRALVVLADGLCGDQMEVVRGAYEAVGSAVPLVGGCAGDDMVMGSTQQIFNDRVLSNAVVVAAISSDAPIGIGVAHGWKPVGQQMLVTGSSGTTVTSLDDRPALDVYLEALNVPEEATENPSAFANFAATHPLGIPRRDKIEIRYIAGADFENRSLTLIASIPQGGTTFLMEGDAQSVLEATGKACTDACNGLEGETPIAMLLFDCVARRSVLESAALENEISTVQDVVGDIPTAGFYTYGEIARTQGAGGFHNQTLVALALA